VKGVEEEKERSTGNLGRVRFNNNNNTNETKYYVLTEGSGYPLADFLRPGLTAQVGPGLIVPENRPKTANIISGVESGEFR
jgi:hypothetical protein